MISRVTATPGGEDIPWLPDQLALTDASGTAWSRATPKRLTEQDARRFIRRSSTRVAIERTPPGIEDVAWSRPVWLLAISSLFSDTIRMDDRGLGAAVDRILVAQLTGEARYHAKWRPLSADEEAAALAGLRALAGGRADLLAEVAGIFEGTSEGELDEPLARCAARLCRQAGADAAAIPAWIEEGRRRSANARQPPFSGGSPP
jgi:hypothetical protein